MRLAHSIPVSAIVDLTLDLEDLKAREALQLQPSWNRLDFWIWMAFEGGYVPRYRTCLEKAGMPETIYTHSAFQ